MYHVLHVNQSPAAPPRVLLMLARMKQKPQLSTFLNNLEEWERLGISKFLLAVYILVSYSCDTGFVSTGCLQNTQYIILLL